VGGVDLDIYMWEGRGGEEEEVNTYISIQSKRVLASYLKLRNN
jgi:hypothetical protein